MNKQQVEKRKRETKGSRISTLGKLAGRKWVQRDSPLIQNESIQTASCITAKDIQILRREYLHLHIRNRENSLRYMNTL